MEEKEGRGVQFRILDGRGRAGRWLRFILALLYVYNILYAPLMFVNKRETFHFLFVAA